MQAIINAFTALFKYLRGGLEWVGKLFIQIFVDLWEFITDAFVWVFDSVLEIAASAIGSLDVGGIPQLSSVVGTLPGEILNILGLLGVGSALGIVMAALTIRFALQMIPFVRFGS